MTGVVVRRIRSGDAALRRDVRLRALATDPGSFGSTYDCEAAFGEERWRRWVDGDAAGDERTTLLALWRHRPGLVQMGLVKRLG